jgi:uncharacterized membrane protein
MDPVGATSPQPPKATPDAGPPAGSAPEGDGARLAAGTGRWRVLGRMLAAWRHAPWTRNERRLMAAGLLLLALLLAELTLLLVLAPGTGGPLAGMLLLEFAVGREGAIPAALAAGVPALLVFQVSLTQDLAFGFLAFGTFLAIWQQASRGNGRVARWLKQRSARPVPMIARWGAIGVFVFMLLPFMVNGPLVGSLAGRAAGLRTRQLVLPVVTATALGAAAWTWASQQAMAWASSIEPWAPPLLALAVVLLGLAFSAWGRRRAAKA